ncbi:magnesium chelatase [Kineosporia sp. J2-2]|uniref:Magnesium chelatase n=1 Tax=Kineosporia corallincola TaxID=2835133 RepID=A0ABS5THD7_9ACTN|nr:magnesium chelatase [Kineosporia corallincola]MBT0770511.1 magnesium chelatase [Kineosporia corallincola]
MTISPDLWPDHLPTTLGALRASGHVHRSVKQEISANLLELMRAGKPRFPGVVGFDETVLPDLERALLAGHDLVLLGERGQGKTRLIRTIVGLLDEWTPVIEGAELNEHPYAPITPSSIRRAAEYGDDLPVAWVHREARYAEKLATPDTSVGDLIGDVDPMKVAEGRTLGDPDTIHFGLVPRMHRGIMAVNELPDLAERIQVALLNVLEERDVQVRGYVLRLDLDLLLLASANPEDYTNRGRIITPLKDRFGAEIRTHYPVDLDLEIELVRQEAELVAVLPDHLVEVLARFTRAVRESNAVDQRSGVSARFSIAAAESVAAAALRRAVLTGELTGRPDDGARAVARVGDTEGITGTLRGKVEFEADGEGREMELLDHLLRRSVAETWRNRLGGVDLTGFVAAVAEGEGVSTGDSVPSADLLAQLGTVPGLSIVLERLGFDDVPGPADAASAIEFTLEGLHLTRRLAKDFLDDGRTVYGGDGE